VGPTKTIKEWPKLGKCPRVPSPKRGGGQPFNSIVNPETGRRCKIYSKTGQRVLYNYLKQYDM
jgi:hypothetical protein